MVSCGSVTEVHDRAVKKLRVDSPVVSQVTYDGVEADGHDRKRRLTQRRDNSSSLSPPQPTQGKREGSATEDGHDHDHDDDDRNSITTEGVSPEATVTFSKSRSHEHEEEEEEDEEHEAQLLDAPHVTSPTRPGASMWRPSPRLSVSGGTATTTTSVTSAPLPVSTSGAITTLRSLSQLAILVSSTNTSSSKEKTHPELRLRAGESVMLLLYFDEASLRPLLNAATSELSQMRVFTLNLAKLPPQDYEAGVGKRLSTGSGVFHATATAATAARTDLASSGAMERKTGRPSGSAPLFAAVQNASVGSDSAEEEEEEEEEEELVPAVHPMAVSTAAAEATASAERERAPRFSSAAAAPAGNVVTALTLDEAASVSSLSGDLHHASEIISEKLRQLLSVDTILNPHASQLLAPSNGSDGIGANSKREPLLFPAMIVWRAAGAPREEYPPAPPQTYSSQPSSTPAELFCDRMSTHGGPLVVKEATSIDQVHSLTLFRPVYTMENLFRTLVRAVAPSFSVKAPGDKSRTVLYLGASWCPPCMRFVHEMPQFMRDDLPSSVVCTVKADMDLAKPIYDYFKVEIIPTFVVLDNEVLMRCYDSLQQRGIAEPAGIVGAASQSEYLRGIQEAFSKAELARLQNSNRQLVSTFVSKHSQTLSFDEDF